MRKDYTKDNSFVTISFNLIASIKYIGTKGNLNYMDKQELYHLTNDDPVFEVLEVFHTDGHKHLSVYKPGYITYFDSDKVYSLKGRKNYKAALKQFFNMAVFFKTKE